jgi:hypothetical protein
MIRSSVRIFSCFITLFSFQTYADDTIRITVKTSENAAAGIGYSVGGKNSGTLGKSYTGKGTKNQEYAFGYRKNSIMGTDIKCGSITLTKDTTITLVTQGDKCLSVVED